MTRDEKVTSLAMVLSVLDEDHPLETWRSARYTKLADTIVDVLGAASLTVIEYPTSSPPPTPAELSTLDKLVGLALGVTRRRRLRVVDPAEPWADDPPMW
jgi:hypothetical protein